MQPIRGAFTSVGSRVSNGLGKSAAQRQLGRDGRYSQLDILGARQKPADHPYARKGQLHRVAVLYDKPPCILSDFEGPLELVVVPNPCSFCGVTKPLPWHRFVLGVLVESGGEPDGHTVVHLFR